MKKCLLFSLIMLFLLFPYRAEAFRVVGTTTSIPSGSQYSPTNAYGFNIKLDNVTDITDVFFEWNELFNHTFSCSSSNCDIWEYDSGFAVGNYNYRWIISNTTDVLTVPSTYGIVKNSSNTITLTLDGTEKDRSYRRYTIANFVARVSVPFKSIKLESTYPGWQTQVNMTVIQNATNLTESGIFSLTASWDGDENYTSSSKTFYFDSGPPQISALTTIPNSPVGYLPNIDYKFQITCRDATLTSVWFESNHTGTMKTYNSASDPPLQNSSGTFWIVLKNLGARSFSYKWHAKDSLNDESPTDFTEYDILKMNPLIMEIFPSTNVEAGDEVTASCRSINDNEINVSNFVFYKDSEMIKNISPSTRLNTFLLSTGTYNFTCNTSGTANYTNQSITRTIAVSSAPPRPGNITGELKILNVNFPSIKAGNNGKATFELVNEMSKNIFNITTILTGMSSDWYNVTKTYIYSSETKEININLTIPPDAESKTYSITIDVRGNTSDGKAVSVSENANMMVTSDAKNQPPSYYSDRSNTTSTGELMFLLELTDDHGLSGYIFSSNISGIWENDSWAPLSGYMETINVTKIAGQNVTDVIAWKIYANDSSNEWITTDEYIYNVKSSTTLGFDMFSIVIALVVMGILAVVIFFVLKRGKGKKEEVEYVYSKEEIEK